MTFPLAGDLPDPWIDGENPNAAAMYQRTTAKHNALATALGTRTARVSCEFAVTGKAITGGAAETNLSVSSITAQTGGTFSTVSLTPTGSGYPAGTGIVMPANGIYLVRLLAYWSTGLTVRNFVDCRREDNLPIFRQPSGYGESDLVGFGYMEVKSAATDAMWLGAYLASGSASLGTMTGSIVKISE